jgi:hypothetical protein
MPFLLDGIFYAKGNMTMRFYAPFHFPLKVNKEASFLKPAPSLHFVYH